MPTIAATTVLYEPMVHRGLIRFDDIQEEYLASVSSGQIQYTAADRDGRVTLFFLSRKFGFPPGLNVAQDGIDADIEVATTYERLYIFKSPPVGENAIAFSVDYTGNFILLVIALSGVDVDFLTSDDVESASEDYVTIDNTFSTNGMSVDATFYDDTTLTSIAPLSGSFPIVWGEIVAGGNGLISAVARPSPVAGADTFDLGYDITFSSGTLRRSIGIALNELPGSLDFPTISATTTLYPPAVTLAGQTINMPTIAAGTVLYGPVLMTSRLTMPTIASTVVYGPTQINLHLTMPTIAAGTVLYPPVVTGPPEHQYLIMTFLGLGTPLVFNMPTIASTVLYAPTITTFNEIEMATIAATTVLYAPVLTSHANTATGGLFPPTVAHV
jgi:hypothetical protein